MEYEDGARIERLYSGKLEKVFPQMRQHSAFYKNPVDSIEVNELGFIGDEHVKIHGGVERAVHHFAQETYKQLKEHFPEAEETLSAGEHNGFGENISTVGGNMNSHTICIGDRFEVGSCVFEVSQPRFPCKKVNYRHNIEKGLTEYTLSEGVSGWFYRVINPGKVSVGDTFKRISHTNPDVTLYKVQTCLFGNEEVKNKYPKEFYQKLVNLQTLSEIPWKKNARKVLGLPNTQTPEQILQELGFNNTTRNNELMKEFDRDLDKVISVLINESEN